MMQRKGLVAILAASAVVAAAVLYILLRPNQAPSAEFAAEPSSAIPLAVLFDASKSLDPDGEIRNFAWDFGDGQTGSGQSVQHTYESKGEFIVSLTITDNRGATRTVSHDVVAYEHLHKLPVPKKWESVSKPEISHPPLFTEIEPADGVVVRGTEAWIRWSSGDEAEGRVLWHKAGEADVRINSASGADPLLARLQPLELGERYEYVVEQITGDFVQRSGLRTFTVEGGVVFDPPVVHQTVQRDYDQSVTLTLRNNTSEPIEIAARALKQFGDLPADIVGPGSVDEPVDLPPAKEMALQLAIFAPDANRFVYEIPIEAAGVVGTARVQIAKPEFDVDIRIVAENPRTLAKTIEIVNNGQSLPDLAVRVIPPNESDLRLDPTLRHAYLSAGEALQVVVSPILYLEFERLDAELRVSAAGQSTGFPLKFEAPEGQRLISVRSQSQKRKGGKTHRCTNRGSSCDEVDGTPDYGPYVPAADIMSEHAMVPTDGDLPMQRVALLGRNPQPWGVKLNTDRSRVNSDRVKSDYETPGQNRSPITMVEFIRGYRAPISETRHMELGRLIDNAIPLGGNAPELAMARANIPLHGQRRSRSYFTSIVPLAAGLVGARNSIIFAQVTGEAGAAEFSVADLEGVSGDLDPPGGDGSACEVEQKPAKCDDPNSCSDPQRMECLFKTATLLARYLELSKTLERVEKRAWRIVQDAAAIGEDPHERPAQDGGTLLNWDPSFSHRMHRYTELMHLEQMMLTLRGQLLDIEDEYYDRKQTCCQECGISLPPLGSPGSFSYQIKDILNDLSNDLRQASAAIPPEGAPFNFPRVGCEWFFEEGGSIEVSTDLKVVEVGIQPPPDWVCLPASSGRDAMRGVSSELADFLEFWVKNDPPSPLYKQVVNPKIPAEYVQMVGKEANRPLRRAVEAQVWAAAYLKAFIAGYERYQGAKQARDNAAMLLQAEAMLDFAERALMARRNVALWVYRWKLAFFRLLKPTMKRIRERGGIAQIVRNYRAGGSGGLTPEDHERFRVEGFSTKEIQIADTWLKQLNYSTVEREIAHFQARMVAAQKVQEEFTVRFPSLTWLEPPEAGPLINLKRYARKLAQQARITLINTPQRELRFTPAKLRPGLLEALQRRAGFSRDHRGPFAARLAGEPDDVADFANGHRSSDRVLLAWHQQNNNVVFAAFDPRGETVIAPHVIGKGRWPRLAADRQRTAVAFLGVDGFVVRVHDGENWSQQITLNGSEAAIAFAPSGSLYAATSTGLWKLTEGGFEQVRQATFAQPALAVDGDGTPVVAWRQDGRIFYEGQNLGRGKRPSVVVSPDGTVHLAYLSDGSIVLRSLDSGQWSQPEVVVPKEKNPSWPALALGEGDEVRLTYIGDAEHGPPAIWLVRLPEKNPILVPSLAGNVTDAWLMLKFSLNDARTRYRRHDMLVTVNDAWIKLFEDTVPEGRYLFRLDPRQIFYSPRRPAPNRIAILNWDMNNGNYIIASDYELIVRTAWSEYFGFASNGQEVIDAAHATWRITHDQPDLVVLANNLDLPVGAPVDSVDFPITVANLGEADAQPARLIMLSGDARLATADIPLLKPEEQTVVNLRLKGTLERVRFEIEQDERDFDPDNDVLDLALWRKEDFTAVQGQSPELPTEPEVTLVPTPNDVQPPWLAGRLPAGATAVGDWTWDRTPSFNAPRSHTSRDVEGRSLHYFIGASEILPLAPGDNLVQYVYLDPQAPPEQILLQLFVEGRKEGQAVYWGGAGDVIRVGGENAKRLGDLPEPGQWVRLRVPVEMLGMKNAWINGLLFGQYGGRAHWGPTAKSISRLDRTEGVMIVSER